MSHGRESQAFKERSPASLFAWDFVLVLCVKRVRHCHRDRDVVGTIQIFSASPCVVGGEVSREWDVSSRSLGTIQ